jgi:hypothetical protein
LNKNQIGAVLIFIRSIFAFFVPYLIFRAVKNILLSKNSGKQRTQRFRNK